MKNIKRALFTAGLISLLPTLAFGALSTRESGFVRNAFKDNRLADHITALLNRDDLATDSITFTVGAPSANAVITAIQVKTGDALGRNGGATNSSPAAVKSLFCYTSLSSTGTGFVTTAGTSAFAVDTNGAVLSLVTGKAAEVLTDATGLAGLKATQTSSTTGTNYLCCAIPQRGVSCSAGFTFQ